VSCESLETAHPRYDVELQDVNRCCEKSDACCWI